MLLVMDMREDGINQFSPEESGKGSLLVMDDEETIREVLGAMLEAVGYTVAFAKDGAEAVRVYRAAAESGRHFSGVIMDLTIPGGMGGAEAVQLIRAFDPAVRAVVTSGYSQDPVVDAYEEYGFVGVLTKPFRIAELEDVLSRVIERSL